MFRKIIVSAVLVMLFTGSVSAAYTPEEDYMEQMICAVMANDSEAGKAAQRIRDEKIAAEGLDYERVEFEHLQMLSKIIQAEAGSGWLGEEWKMAVGEVVLNRIASPEFPNTMREVLEQPGQYYGKNSSFFQKLKPSRESVVAAMKLLEGERVLNEPSVVFQANFRLGSGVFLELRDKALGSTYLCYSSHMELYNT